MNWKKAKPISGAVVEEATINISGVSFQLSRHAGIYIKTGEAFCLENNSAKNIEIYATICPEGAGSDILTEFIGDIPKSKAAMHSHLYEETLVILEGEGTMWTENLKTDVMPGDIIFLPRKQIHSLECTSEQGMRLAGVIYPGDNPAINY